MTLRPRSIRGAILLAFVVAACDALARPSTSPRATEEEFVVPPPPAAAQAVACVRILPAECARVTDRILQGLPGVLGSPFSIRTELFGCPDETPPCPESLADRQGQAFVEYPDGGEALLFDVAGPAAAPVVEHVEAALWTGPIHPGSTPVDGPGPFEFEVGHCGLVHAVDFAGSFWVLVGEISGDHPALGGAEIGAIRLIDQDRAEYLGSGNARIGLARFPGAKRFQPCR
jgi:hypothetical protein